MRTWRSLLNADPTDWLLEDDNPSVKYFTLTEILGKSLKNSEVRETKKAIMNSNVVTKILEKQEPKGHWGKPEDFYVRSKYRGTVWSFLVLAELGADGKDERIKNAFEFITKWSQDRQSGGFAHIGTARNGGRHGMVIPCLTGNMIYSMIRFGYLKDKRVKQGLEFITTYQRFDDRNKDYPKVWPYDKYNNCYGKHTCHMGAAKALKALAEIPVDKRTKAMKATIDGGIEYFLKHHIYKRSHNLEKVSKPSWLNFGFPLMYQTDILELLNILLKLGVKDVRMQDAFNIVVSKQDKNGRWLLENTFNKKMITNIEQKGKPSKWVTLQALMAIKNYKV